MSLLYLVNNAIIKAAYLKNRENEKKLVISFKNLEEKENAIRCDGYIVESKNGALAELDLLLIKEENGSLYVESYELKASRRNNFSKPEIQKQLFKQGLLLTFLLMDGLLIKHRDLCILENRKNVNQYIVRIKYLNGVRETTLKDLDIQSKIDYISKRGYLVYEIRVNNEETDFLIDFYGVFTNRIYHEVIRIKKESLKEYINVLLENYVKIVKSFLSAVLKEDSKDKKSLSEIINRFITRSYSQDKE